MTCKFSHPWCLRMKCLITWIFWYPLYTHLEQPNIGSFPHSYFMWRATVDFLQYCFAQLGHLNCLPKINNKNSNKSETSTTPYLKPFTHIQPRSESVVSLIYTWKGRRNGMVCILQKYIMYLQYGMFFYVCSKRVLSVALVIAKFASKHWSFPALVLHVTLQVDFSFVMFTALTRKSRGMLQKVVLRNIWKIHFLFYDQRFVFETPLIVRIFDYPERKIFRIIERTDQLTGIL